MPADHVTLMTLAATIYGEARGESFAGKLAVACVIRNRANKPGWWGRDIVGVCKAPYQFSCWNQGAPNRPLLEEAVRHQPVGNKAWDECVIAARTVLDPQMPDITKGANHYCTKAVVGRVVWAKGQTPVATIGAHHFFKL